MAAHLGGKCETLYLGKRATSQQMNHAIGMSDFRLFQYTHAGGGVRKSSNLMAI